MTKHYRVHGWLHERFPFFLVCMSISERRMIKLWKWTRRVRKSVTWLRHDDWALYNYCNNTSSPKTHKPVDSSNLFEMKRSVSTTSRSWVCIDFNLSSLYRVARYSHPAGSLPWHIGPRSIAGVPFDSVRRFRATLLLRTTCMRLCCNGVASCVAAQQTKN